MISEWTHYRYVVVPQKYHYQKLWFAYNNNLHFQDSGRLWKMLNLNITCNEMCMYVRLNFLYITLFCWKIVLLLLRPLFHTSSSNSNQGYIIMVTNTYIFQFGSFGKNSLSDRSFFSILFLWSIIFLKFRYDFKIRSHLYIDAIRINIYHTI